MHRIIDFEYTGKADIIALSAVTNATERVKRSGQANGYKAAARRSINNYLKSPEEIEAELVFTAHFDTDSLNTGRSTTTTTDGYYHTHSSVEGLSGTMEENY